MQKKFIALAVAGLVSGAAFAQSNVTIYGVVDLAVTQSGDHTTDNKASNTGVDDGGRDSSRFGWKGTEDLGNGLSVSFGQQMRQYADTRSSGLRMDSSYLSLDSKSWGSIKAGNFGNVHDDIIGYSEAGGFSWGKGVLDPVVTDTTYNSINYISPSFSGLQGRVSFSANDIDAKETDNDSNIKAYGVNLTYVNGPLKIGGAYDRKNTDNGAAASGDMNTWSLSGGYDFGVVKVGATYARDRVDGISDFAVKTYNEAGATTGTYSDYTKKSWRVNVGAPIGATNHINLHYSHIKADIANVTDQSVSAWGLSFSHAMSKRTDLYAAYADINQSEDTAMLYTGYQSKFKVGLRHRF